MNKLLKQLFVLAIAVGAGGVHADELVGIPISMSYLQAPQAPRQLLLAITLDVEGKILVASSLGSEGFQMSIQQMEMLSVLNAAIARKEPIKLQGTLLKDSLLPEASYPYGDFRITKLEVFGYMWGKEYLNFHK